jgi:DNA-binding NarL/FixJ family response regulator
MGLTVVIADPRELLRLGVHTLFEQDSRVSDVHQAETFDELIAVLASYQDQIDLVMVAQELIAGIESRIELLPRDKFAILTSKPELAILRAAVKHGARGYLTESVSGELVRTLLRPAAGAFLLDPALTSWMIGLLKEEQTHSAEALLTPRELEVYRLLQRGLSKQEITAQLHIAEATVDTHIKNIKRKFRGDRPEEE